MFRIISRWFIKLSLQISLANKGVAKSISSHAEGLCDNQKSPIWGLCGKMVKEDMGSKSEYDHHQIQHSPKLMEDNCLIDSMQNQPPISSLLKSGPHITIRNEDTSFHLLVAGTKGQEMTSSTLGHDEYSIRTRGKGMEQMVTAEGMIS